MSSLRPLVSVIIPARNSAITIQRALRSVLLQDYNNIEILIADDASTDDTIATVTAWDTAGVTQVVSIERNVGAASARNRCMAIARGEYFAFLDADDEWLPGKLQAQIRALEENPNAALCTCNSERIGTDGQVVMRTFAHFPPHAGPSAWRTLLRYNFMPTPTVAVRASAVRDAQGFRSDLVVGEDLDLWIRLSVKHDILVIPAVHVRYHDSHVGISATYAESSHQVVLPMLKRHFDELRSSMTDIEATQIWSERLFRTALEMRGLGRTADAARLFWRTLVMGPRRLRSLLLLASCLLPPSMLRRNVGPGAPV